MYFSFFLSLSPCLSYPSWSPVSWQRIPLNRHAFLHSQGHIHTHTQVVGFSSPAFPTSCVAQSSSGPPLVDHLTLQLLPVGTVYHWLSAGSRFCYGPAAWLQVYCRPYKIPWCSLQFGIHSPSFKISTSGRNQVVREKTIANIYWALCASLCVKCFKNIVMYFLYKNCMTTVPINSVDLRAMELCLFHRWGSEGLKLSNLLKIQ